MNKISLFFTLIVFSFCSIVEATEDVQSKDRKRIEPYGLLYGAGLGINQELYKGYKRRVIPLPVIGYRGKKLQVFGPFASYNLVQTEHLSFSAKLSPRFQGFDESDSDIFIGMDERKFSMDLGAGAEYKYNNWKVSVDSMFDVLARSNGYENTFNVAKVLRYGPIFVEPSVSLAYLDEDMVNYYYGVRPEEATTERQAYIADSAFNTSLGISVTTPILFKGLTRLSVSHTWYDDDIADSPLTDSKRGYSLILTYSRFFKM